MGLNCLPSLFNHFSDVIGRINRNDDTLRDTDRADGCRLRALLRSLRDLRRRHLNRDSPLIVRRVSNSHQRLLRHTTTAVGIRSTELRKYLKGVDSSFSHHLIRACLTSFTRSRRITGSRLTRLRMRLRTLQSRHRVLSSTITALRGTNVRSLTGSVRLALDGIARLNLTPPRVRLIVVTVRRLGGALVSTDGSVTFVSVLHRDSGLGLGVSTRIRGISIRGSVVRTSLNEVGCLRTVLLVRSSHRACTSVCNNTIGTCRRFLATATPTGFASVRAVAGTFGTRTTLFVEFLTPMSVPVH